MIAVKCVINITKAGAAMTSASSVPMPPSYDLCLEEIDELVGALFVAASRNPKAYFGRFFKEDAKQYLIKDNTVSAITGAIAGP
jgi:hypothetical protein